MVCTNDATKLFKLSDEYDRTVNSHHFDTQRTGDFNGKRRQSFACFTLIQAEFEPASLHLKANFF